MKIIAVILFYTFTILTFCPAAELVASATGACGAVCSGDDAMKCAKEQEAEDTGCCPIEMCNSCQCCLCCFACPVENKNITIRIIETQVEKGVAKDAFTLPGFTSDCWQPPKFI